MIRVGDKYYHEDSEWLVVNVHYPIQLAGDIYHFVIENEGVQMRIPLALYYKEMYEQQKQRADELEHKLKKEIEESERQLRRWYEELKRADRLEKRWSELRERLNDVWMNGDADEHEYAFNVLKLMEQLEEDGE